MLSYMAVNLAVSRLYQNTEKTKNNKYRTLTLNHAVALLQHRMLATYRHHLLRHLRGFLYKELSHKTRSQKRAAEGIDYHI